MFSVRVPATIANMGPGFDSLGMAVSLYNQFRFQTATEDRLLFSPEGAADVSDLTDSGSDNLLFHAMNVVYDAAKQKRPPFAVEVVTDIPVARGLGSSSTAVVAGLLAANQFLNCPFDTQALLKMGIEMEGHPDNVAPALLGGVVLYDTAAYKLPWSVEWRVLTLSPPYPVLTEEARKILPKTVSLDDSIFNMRKTSVLTYALLLEDPDALRASLHDRLHQPHRKHLIKEYDGLEKVVMDAGALGMVISGSGSTMAVFYPTVIHAYMMETIQAAMAKNGWAFEINDLTVDENGAELVSNSL